jgi:large subunit ribosomal protein L24
VSGADIATLWPKEASAPARGRVSLQLDAKGTGRSPAALVGSLGGSGTVSFEQVEIPALSPEVFAAAMRTADQHNEIAADAVKAAVAGALDTGVFKAARADGALTLTAGQLRVGSLMAQGDRSDLAVTANLDLVQAQIEARLALLGAAAKEGSVGRPEVDVALRGPIDSPRRSVDVSALVGWLTLRAVDLQAKRLKDAEAERRRGEETIRRANEEAARRAAAAEAARRAAEAQARREAEELMRTQSVPPKPAPPVEQAPALPPPIDIRPAPGQRRTSTPRSSPQASAERQPPLPSRLDLFFRPPER